MRLRFLPALPLLVWIVLVPAAHATKAVTVAQLEKLLEADRGHSDRHVAGQLAKLTLSERLSSERLDRWESDFPGRRTQAALLLLADEAAFLSLPAADIAPDAPPPFADQGKIFSRVVEYTVRTVHNLPNFLATRTTSHFEGSLLDVMKQSGKAASGADQGLGMPGTPIESANYLPLHLDGKSSVPVAYRDGHEIRSAYSRPSLGLTTTGEFGPILTVVMSDAVHNQIRWGYWQRTSSGLIAVFRYQVPASGSHYGVSFPSDVVQSHPAYHGEIAVDPATGSIRRLSIISEIEPPLQPVGTGIVVEYGPVRIGDRTYICPLRGVALSKTPLLPGIGMPAPANAPLQVHLNDVAFTRYHLFRAEARILSAQELQRLEETQKQPPR